MLVELIVARKYTMKKNILVIMFSFMFVMGLNAQSDSFFSSNYTEYRENSWTPMPLLPDHHGSLNDFDADEVTLGGGVVVLSILGLAYRKRKTES